MRRILCVLFGAGLSLVITGCMQRDSAPQSAAAIESIGMHALQATGQQQQRALDKLTEWARQGNPIAQRELGLALSTKIQTWADAREWLTRAADSGESQAAFKLAQAYSKGEIGITADQGVARKWYETAATGGHAAATRIFAQMLKNGDGGKADVAKAMQWLERAGKSGDAQAMFLLFNIYAHGDGVAVNLEQARDWLEGAVDKHYSPALHAYAMALETGEFGFERNPVKAREHFQEALEERRNYWNRP